MAGEVLTETSIVPAVVFLLPMLAGAVVFSATRMGRTFQQWICVLTATLVTGLCAWMAYRVLEGVVLTTWSGELRVDALSALMVVIIGGIGLLTSIYSVRYLEERMVEATAARRIRIFYGLLMSFLGTMLWGCVTNNVIMLYVAIEATTLTSGLLVAFYWDRRALEAGYKYLMLLTIGITFALFGCVLLYAGAAATDKLAGASALLISNIRNVAQFIPSGTAAITIAFLVIGFGTKAGIAPFHPWLPDAHAEAPTPISVLLSGVMIKMALYAMARTVSILPRLASGHDLPRGAGRLHHAARHYPGVDPRRPQALARVFIREPDGLCAGRHRPRNVPGMLRRPLSLAEPCHLQVPAVHVRGCGDVCHGRAANNRARRIEKADAHHERVFLSWGTGDCRLPTAQWILEQADRLSGAGQGRTVVGGGYCRCGEYFDHGRYGAGGVQSVLGRARLNQHPHTGCAGSAGAHVGPHGVPGGDVRTAWNLPANALPAAGSCRSGSGHPGKVKGGNMLKDLCRKALGKALWVYHANCGACNGCDIEIINVLTPYYDAERFGIKLVGSPRHADVILISGPVTRQVEPALKRLVEAVPNPKLTFAVGSCATGGGCWFDTYNVMGGADKVIPVDFYIPGCPPRPEAILYGVAFALGLVPKKVAEEKLSQETLEELACGKSIVTGKSAYKEP